MQIQTLLHTVTYRVCFKPKEEKTLTVQTSSGINAGIFPVFLVSVLTVYPCLFQGFSLQSWLHRHAYLPYGECDEQWNMFGARADSI